MLQRKQPNGDIVRTEFLRKRLDGRRSIQIENSSSIRHGAINVQRGGSTGVTIDRSIESDTRASGELMLARNLEGEIVSSREESSTRIVLILRDVDCHARMRVSTDFVRHLIREHNRRF